jgi:hypothetical protein
MHHYCTLFDSNYLSRGLALHRSLRRHARDFTLHVLCLDTATRQALASLALPSVELITLEALQDWDPDLRAVRASRTPAEFYFTCKPYLLRYLLARARDLDRLSYLDSDLYFFSDAAQVERECAGSSIALSPHRFGPRSAHRRKYGEFNAGWVSVDGSAEANRFVEWWRDRCLEWCSMLVEDSRFADQKYLDRVPVLFAGTYILSHPGMNLGPWNIVPGGIACPASGTTVGRRPLVFFHFHNVRRMLFSVYDCGLFEYGVALTPEIREGIYRPYLVELAACVRVASRLAPTESVTLDPLGVARRLAKTVRAIARHCAVRVS